MAHGSTDLKGCCGVGMGSCVYQNNIVSCCLCAAALCDELTDALDTNIHVALDVASPAHVGLVGMCFRGIHVCCCTCLQYLQSGADCGHRNLYLGCYSLVYRRTC